MTGIQEGSRQLGPTLLPSPLSRFPSHMAHPLCLIENRPGGRLVLREEALAVLQRIRQPVVVVAIVGLYRTGKSYLMNRLASQQKGFSLGSTVQGKTKGIWMWCRPHPQRSDHTLVLLDTEGLGDTGKGNTQNDAWIFALAILLSSTLVYNSMGTIDQNALEKLQYPSLGGDTEQIRRCNEPRLCIRKFFPSRKCFTFVWPTTMNNLQRLEELQEEDLEERFREAVARFCKHIWETSKCKMVPGGQPVTGAKPDFVEQADHFCNYIYGTSKEKTLLGGMCSLGTVSPSCPPTLLPLS
nr:guanylate-binding protein 1-like [Anolis sagrei ordinatus]